MTSRFFSMMVMVTAFAMAGAEVGRAQDAAPTAQQTAGIEACVKQKAETEEGAESCIYNLVAKPCLNANEGTTQGMADCFRVETQIWDRLLNAAYKDLNNELEAAQKTKLRDMQRAWIISRDRTCGFYYEKIGGSMAIPMGAECMLRETARRALLLKQFVGL